MKKIVIVGAGGFGRELYYWMKDHLKDGEKVQGFLSNSPADLEGYPQLPPYLGKVDQYKPAADEVFIVAIGDSEVRKNICTEIRKKGGTFYTFIHPSSVVTETAVIGEGSIIGPLSVISNEAQIGEQVVINASCVIGHDSKIGAFSTLSPMSGIMGGAELEEGVFLGAGATVIPRLNIGKGAKISAGVSVFRDVPAMNLVTGAMTRMTPFAVPHSQD